MILGGEERIDLYFSLKSKKGKLQDLEKKKKIRNKKTRIGMMHIIPNINKLDRANPPPPPKKKKRKKI